MEINPNNAAVIRARDQWHKIAAILMVKFDQTAVEITLADVDILGDNERAVVIDERGGKLVIRLVTMEEGERLAREDGGLPV